MSITITAANIGQYRNASGMDFQGSFVLGEDITITDGPYVFSGWMYATSVTFNGNGHKFIINNVTDFAGVFYHGAAVSNLGVVATGSTTLANYEGFLFSQSSSNAGHIPTATNCYVMGTIGDPTNVWASNFSGGLFGAGSSGLATGCYFIGNMYAYAAGCIFGYNASTYSRATRCYSNSRIPQFGGGIFGMEGKGIAEKCFSVGEIAGYGAGGIFGYNTNSDSHAIACFSRGNITGENAGGIFGQLQWDAKATNCYSSGSITGTNAAGIFSPAQSIGPQTLNCYAANGTWSDSAAAAALVGEPGDSDQVWYSTVSNKPYILLPDVLPYTPSSDKSLSVFMINSTDVLTSSDNVILPLLTASVSVSVTPNYWNTSVSVSNTANLIDGSNNLTITVTAEDGTVQIYERNAYVTPRPTRPSGFTVNQTNIDLFLLWGLESGNTYTLAEDVNITSNAITQQLIGGSREGIQFVQIGENVVFNGNNKVITIVDIENFPGLFNKGVTVNDLGIVSSGSTSFKWGVGWFFTGSNSTNRPVPGCVANNCYSTGTIANGGGGIFGTNAYGTATNCYSTGDINNGGGGIFAGQGAAGQAGKTAINCYSTGLIDGDSGGIFGSNNLCNITALKCYTTGKIGTGSGGICGPYCTNATITSSYSRGHMSGANSGGICGQNCNGTISNCYSTGIINGDGAGGIVGNNSTVTLNGCYSTGFICNATNGLQSNSGTITFGSRPSGYTNGWIDSSANMFLTGYPGDSANEQVWFSPKSDTPNLPYLFATPSSYTMSSDVSCTSLTFKDLNMSDSSVNGGTSTLHPYSLSINMSILPTTYKTRLNITGASSFITGNNLVTVQIIAEDGTTATYTHTFIVPTPPPTPTSTNIDQSNLIGYLTFGFPTGFTYTLVEDVIIEPSMLTYPLTANFFSSAGDWGPQTIFDGSGYSITIKDIPDYQGLFQAGYPNIIIKNFGVKSSGTTTLADSRGWILRQWSAGENLLVENCYSTGAIPTNGGGIAGTYVRATIRNCYSTGDLPHQYCAGIIFTAAFPATIQNCYSTGNITGGSTACGIAYQHNEEVTISNCFSVGAISNGSQGIGNGSFTNCYTADGSWSTAAANQQLLGYPGDTANPEVWASNNGAHYLLKSMSIMRSGSSGGGGGGGLPPTGPATRTITILNIPIIKADESVALSVIVSPPLAIGESLTYSTSDSSIATVSSNGVVVGSNSGSCTITVSSAASSSYTDASSSKLVVILPANIPSLSDAITEGTIPVGYEVSASIQPEGVTEAVSFVIKSFEPVTVGSVKKVEYVPTVATAVKVTVDNLPAEITKVTIATSAPTVSGTVALYVDAFKVVNSSQVNVHDFADTPLSLTFVIPGASQGSVYIFTKYMSDGSTIVYPNVTVGMGGAVTLGNVTSLCNMTGELQSQNVPCFPAGTKILTAAGYKAVEKLSAEDRIITADGRSVKFNLYTTHVANTTKQTAPYHIKAGAFGNNSPAADIKLSPLHAIQSAKGVWQIPKYAALSNAAVQQYAIGKSITYYHVELPNFFTDNIVAEGGVVVESYAAKQCQGMKTLYKFNSTLGGFTRANKNVAMTNSK